MIAGVFFCLAQRCKKHDSKHRSTKRTKGEKIGGALLSCGMVISWYGVKVGTVISWYGVKVGTVISWYSVKVVTKKNHTTSVN